jgi:pantoate--beta-alanine ligase
VEVVFAPAPEEVYPPGAATFVEVEGLSQRLDGNSRPGHFRGVATIVAKLLIAAEPDRAFFGQKDAAQVAVLRRMIADLGLPVELAVCPIVREPDGLAMSSRNRYLNPEERRQALVLHRALNAVKSAMDAGKRNSETLISVAQATFASEPEVHVDYIAAVDWATLEPVEIAHPGTLFAIAAWVGKTRLIDNLVLE